MMRTKTALAARCLSAALLVFVVHVFISQNYKCGRSALVDRNSLRPILADKKGFSANNIQQILPHNGSNRPLKKIILWTGFFGSKTWHIPWPHGSLDKVISCSDRNTRCILSVNRTNPLSYDALLFHGRDRFSVPKQRNPHQVYLMLLRESPVHRGPFARGGSFYNWTATYAKNSDIVMQHGYWSRLPQRNDDAHKTLPQLQKKRPNGRATILWIVTNCKSNSRRRHYVHQLQCHIKVDVFGGCGKTCPKGTAGNDKNCYENLGRTGQYKFYLAFENSACPDYISLKPYRALNNSMVPIVLGGTSAQQYKGMFPPNAYIDVRNFTSPKHLAEYLHYLDKHDDVYLAYHAWRKEYWVEERRLRPTFCQICDALHNATMMKPRNVDFDEFWSPRKCQNLVNELLEPLPPNHSADKYYANCN